MLRVWTRCACPNGVTKILALGQEARGGFFAVLGVAQIASTAPRRWARFFCQDFWRGFGRCWRRVEPLPSLAPAALERPALFLSGIFARARAPRTPYIPPPTAAPPPFTPPVHAPHARRRRKMALRATAAALSPSPDARDDALPVHLVADLGAPLAVPIVRRDPARCARCGAPPGGLDPSDHPAQTWRCALCGHANRGFLAPDAPERAHAAVEYAPPSDQPPFSAVAAHAPPASLLLVVDAAPPSTLRAAMAAVLPRLPADAAVGLRTYGAASAAVYELASASTDLATADAFGLPRPDAADAARPRPRRPLPRAAPRRRRRPRPLPDRPRARGRRGRRHHRRTALHRGGARARARAAPRHRAARGDVVLVGGAGAPAASAAALRALGDAACAASVCVHLVVGADAPPAAAALLRALVLPSAGELVRGAGDGDALAASLSRALLRTADGGGCAATLEARTSTGLAVAAVMGPAAASDDDDDAAALCRVAAVHPASRLYLRLEADQPLRQTHATVQLALRYTAAAPPHERRLRVPTLNPVAADAAAAAAAAEPEGTALAAAFGVALRAESGAALGAAAARARALCGATARPTRRCAAAGCGTRSRSPAPPPALTPALRLLCAVEGCAKGGGQEAARARRRGGRRRRAVGGASSGWRAAARASRGAARERGRRRDARRHATNERASVGRRRCRRRRGRRGGGRDSVAIHLVRSPVNQRHRAGRITDYFEPIRTHTTAQRHSGGDSGVSASVLGLVHVGVAAGFVTTSVWPCAQAMYSAVHRLLLRLVTSAPSASSAATSAARPRRAASRACRPRASPRPANTRDREEAQL